MRTRAAAERSGRRAETLAAWLLRAKGYHVLARRYRAPGGEIDIVARRAGTLVFVEVKERASAAQAAEAIRTRQRRRILAAARHFLARRPELTQLRLRFDAVLVIPGRLPRHIADAWRAHEPSLN